MADNTLNRSELVAEVANKTGETQAAVNGVLDAVFATISENIANGVKVSVPGWLSVERTNRAARTGRNPQTGETLNIPASKGVKISAGSKLKAAVK
ncbi:MULTISPECIES: HU family DNA-binding protein [unclassified Pseudoclavibacter]|uniref:HU family DNA-binding protein n=1 Tax=unclassified Pseudoclavibacter TaxID=2615177 RepID=UPI001301449F|nr:MULTISPECIES: HU family DNA-binding protein [unclassified Pseudoclavibacter]KAB1644539.1 integration host factor [Pseudoclavibacter sp. CFCC 14310]KAB1659123.1 integration host factor [Pseudoclavibacter sp. CFCC 11306]KAB1660897.1 integration host factor [Pseudoclavibacter sp. CFCC 13796]KAB1663959.1 integration host factor [Pseudoclavibacter sp. CFCC 13611]